MVIVETLNLPSQHIGTVVKSKVSSCGHAKKRKQKKPQPQQLWLDLFLTQVSIIKPVKQCARRNTGLPLCWICTPKLYSRTELRQRPIWNSWCGLARQWQDEHVGVKVQNACMQGLWRRVN